VDPKTLALAAGSTLVAYELAMTGLALLVVNKQKKLDATIAGGMDKIDADKYRMRNWYRLPFTPK
jgi:hypothetical protein